jgi:2-(1,2-epoxy-1,2-dihydrophenyl)acetyl-CoA isomerase
MADRAPVAVERDGSVAVVTLTRPEVLNAFDRALRCGLRDVLDTLGNDASVRAVVLTGAGRYFSSGADLKAGAPSADETRAQLLDEYGPGLIAIARMPKPVIAALDGPAVGIGLAYALSCDLRVMAEDAFLQAPFNSIGLIPDGGLSWLLPQALGYARAFETVVDAEILGADECLRLGLVNRVVAAGTATAESRVWAARLARRPALAVAASKRALRAGCVGTYEEALRLEAALQAPLVESADCAEGIAAFREKRDPHFTGR